MVMLYKSQYYGVCDLGDSLCHHGILGQKWGVRRYQNPDGTLTEAGRKRYLKDNGNINLKGIRASKKASDKAYAELYNVYDVKGLSQKLSKTYNEYVKAKNKVQDNYVKVFQNGPKDPDYRKAVDYVLKNHAYDEEIKKLLNDDLYGDDPKVRQSAGMVSDLVYGRYKSKHPELQKDEDQWMKLKDKWYKESRILANQAMSKHGTKQYDVWKNVDDWGLTKNEIENEKIRDKVDLLSFVVREENEKHNKSKQK